MRLVQLAYASACVGRLQLNTIENILSKAVEKNRALGITGFLCFDHKYFLQVLEGERRAVNALYHLIAADSRHANATLLLFREITTRDFPEWAMGDCNLENLKPSPVFRHCATRSFRPQQMSGDAALQLLKELSEIRMERSLTHGI